MSIQVKNINKSFEKFKALDNVSLNVPGGELLALLGPSGSGKTTLLRIIAGLEQPDASPDSAILFDGIDVTRSPVGSRRVGFVFQHYALFKHMSVLENVAFGMRVKARKDRRPRSEIKDKALELIKLVQLENMANRLPSQLSGGQRQRVALARALAVEPKVLLLDEPFGALDARVRQDLRRWLRKLHDEIHVTSVFVTHDQEEALEVADKVVVMNQGRIEQVGTPDEVFHNPANSFVMHFLGHVNLFHGRMDGGQAVLSEQENPSRLMVRPFDLDVTTAPSQGTLPVQVTRIQSAGPVVKIDLTAPDGQIFQAELPHEKFRELAIKQSDNVFIAPRAAKIFREDYSI